MKFVNPLEDDSDVGIVTGTLLLVCYILAVVFAAAGWVGAVTHFFDALPWGVPVLVAPLVWFVWVKGIKR